MVLYTPIYFTKMKNRTIDDLKNKQTNKKTPRERQGQIVKTTRFSFFKNAYKVHFKILQSKDFSHKTIAVRKSSTTPFAKYVM